METRDIWLTAPPIPLTTPEMDSVYDLPFARAPHPSYADAKIPAWEMIRHSVTIMRGCFGGCSFCSITEHEGRIIQIALGRIRSSKRSRRSATRPKVSLASSPTLAGRPPICIAWPARTARRRPLCRRPACVYPDICKNLDTSHDALIQLYRKARALPGVKKVMVASGVRYDLAVKSPAYVRELVEHHVGGYLKIAPEHTEDGPLVEDDEARHRLL